MLNSLLSDFAKKAQITKLLPGHHYTIEELSPYVSQFDECTGDAVQVLKVAGQTGYAAVITPSSDYLTKEAAAGGP